MDAGLSIETIQKMHNIFVQFPQIEQVILYGSRAKGNYKTGSDIDITLIGHDLTHELLLQVSNALDEILLPYTIDISIYEHISHANLKEHINRIGIEFYRKRI